MKYMYKLIAKLDKQNRITIPEVIRELIKVGPGDIVEVDVVGKVEPDKNS
jgi:AbrB family looped-hinge helix DNA binding protein